MRATLTVCKLTWTLWFFCIFTCSTTLLCIFVKVWNVNVRFCVRINEWLLTENIYFDLLRLICFILYTVASCWTLAVAHSGPTPTTWEHCWYQGLITVLATGTSRPPFLRCGALYHPDCDDLNWNSTLSDITWRHSCFSVTAAHSPYSSLYLYALYKSTLSIYLSISLYFSVKVRDVSVRHLTMFSTWRVA